MEKLTYINSLAELSMNRTAQEDVFRQKEPFLRLPKPQKTNAQGNPPGVGAASSREGVIRSS